MKPANEVFTSHVADLLHLLQFAEITPATPTDKPLIEKLMCQLAEDLHAARHPAYGPEGSLHRADIDSGEILYDGEPEGEL